MNSLTAAAALPPSGFRQGLILRLHLRRGGVQIQIRRKGQLHISGNALHPRPDQQGKRQIGVAKRIGRAKLRRRYSPSAAGTRISWERFSADQEIYRGAL